MIGRRDSPVTADSITNINLSIMPVNHNVPSDFKKFRNSIPKFLELFDEHQDAFIVLYYNHCCKLFKTYGQRESVKVMKNIYNDALNYSLGTPIDLYSSPWTRRLRNGLPSFLKTVSHSLRGKKARIILTVLRGYESILLEPIPDLASVTEESTGKAYYHYILRPPFIAFLQRSHFVKKVRKLLSNAIRLERENNKDSVKFHYTAKAGIEGPSLPTAGKQSLGISSDLLEPMMEINNVFNRSEFSTILSYNKRVYSKVNDFYPVTNKISDYTGRITFVSAAGGKSRLVAIGNYWVQDTLRALHKVIYKVLKDIPQDGLYSQNRAADSVKRSTLNKRRDSIPYSYDLTKATDRFPIDPQIDLLTSLNSIIGPSWAKIMDSLTFVYNDKAIKYKVGQPMGLYSSWAVFALTHHCLIQYCAYVVNNYNLKLFTKYALLGDDVVIWDPKVAELYRFTIENLAIDISLAKSFYPERYLPTNSIIAEFAKRIFRDGKEITPIPPKLVIESVTSYSEIPEIIQFLEERDFLCKSLPVSKVKSVVGLNDLDEIYLVLACRVKDLLGTPVKRLTLHDQRQLLFYNSISLIDILTVRVDALSEQISNLMSDLFDIEDEMRTVLDKIQETDSNSLLICSLILDNRIRQAMKLEDRLTKFIPFSSYEREYALDEELAWVNESPDQVIRQLDEIEYLPTPTVKSIVAKKERLPSKTRNMRSKYIMKIAEQLVKTIG